MFTIYLPLALVSLWRDGMSHESPDDTSRLCLVLDHTMALVSAITLACKRTMTQVRASAYHDCVATWLGNLTKIHLEACPQPNCHMALHIYDFLLLFGPVRSWWCFPFEQLIGQLQWLLSNHKLGMTDFFLSYMLLMMLQERWKAHYFVLSSELQAFGGGLAG